MIIDFHTHIFPDALAERAVGALSASIDNLYPPVHDGTLAGLLKKMDEYRVDISVVLPVVTKQSQFKKTNDWAAGINYGRIVAFGGIYPHTDDYRRDIDYVASLGLKGIKFHAEYQDFILDEPKMIQIYEYALNKGLILLHHGGFDPAFAPPFRSDPVRFARLWNIFRGGVIIAAHLGGHGQWEEVENTLAGSGIYLDTSMGFGYYPKERFLSIVKKHGADKILFGSDSPWSGAGKEIARLKSSGLAEDEKELILQGNANRLLGF